MAPEKMIYMANQIAGFFKTQRKTDQAQSIADHLSDFWEPRMIAQLKAYIADGGADLDEMVVDAAKRL